MTDSTRSPSFDGKRRDAKLRPTPAIKAMAAIVITAINIARGQGRAMPEKPMNASDIIPAVIRAIAVPRNAAGISAASIRSRIAANMTSTKAKPSDAPKPKKID